MQATSSIAPEAPEVTSKQLSALAERLRKKSGFDLLSYKPRLLKRRLMVRIRARKCRDLAEYMELLDREPAEEEAFYQALNIHVSGFFRNPETFRFLRERILPGLIARKAAAQEKLLILSAGCALGEEPYSLALMMKHFFKKDLRNTGVKIVGMDISPEVVDRARAAVYDPDRVKELPDEMFRHYFLVKNKKFHLHKEIKSMVEFMAHDVREPLPWAGIDLITCRNLLIYFTRAEQKRILKNFDESLTPQGYLVLGKTESMLSELRSGFKVVDLSEHIYQKAGEEPCGWR